MAYRWCEPARAVLRLPSGPIGDGAVTMAWTTPRIAAMVLLAAVAGCGGPPWAVQKSPDAIAVRWYPDETDIVAANHLAELHCRSWGRIAQLAFDSRDGSDEVAQYRCR
jgi:hypothetical protein